MTEKELRRLSKTDMLELLLQQSKIIHDLRQKNAELEERLQNSDKMLNELKEHISSEIHHAVKEALNDCQQKGGGI